MYLVLITFLIFVIFGHFGEGYNTTECGPLQAKRVYVTDTNAKCIDGSSPAFYIKNGSGNGIRKWLVFFEGGGWCYTLSDCLARSKGRLGSSKVYTKCIDSSDMKFYLSGEFSKNPMMYNWNIVLVKYCDATSYAGNADINFQGKMLYFRGKANRDATIETLMLDHKMKFASEIVLGGCSAGGLGIYLGLDQMRHIISSYNPHILVTGFSDSGIFLDYSSHGHSKFGRKHYTEALIDGRIDYATTMRALFHRLNISAGAPQDCVYYHNHSNRSNGKKHHPHTSRHKRNSYKPDDCIFADHLIRFIKTPMFALQPRYDQWQLHHVIGSSFKSVVTEFGKNLTNIIVKYLLPNTHNGAFIDSCAHHCTSCSANGEDSWNGPRVVVERLPERINPAMAFTRWYNATTYAMTAAAMARGDKLRRPISTQSIATTDSSKYLFMQPGKFPCDTCCFCRA